VPIFGGLARIVMRLGSAEVLCARPMTRHHRTPAKIGWPVCVCHNRISVMIRRRTLALFFMIALGLSIALPPAAHAENPLEKLHKKVFGDDDRKDGKKKKDKDKDRDWDRHDDDRRRHNDDRHYHHEPVVVERRIYVESRPSYERYDAPRPIEADVQIALRRRGYYRGSIDGHLGRGTRSAIFDYQEDHRLPATGRIDNYLLRSLGL
jgi:hypothetical protein